MSYILDALRKSDQQRQRGATPTLQTAPVAAAEPRPAEQWIYGLIAAVLVSAGVVIGWLHPWQSEPPNREGAPIAREAMAVKSMESSMRQTTPVPVVPPPARVSPQMNGAPAREPPNQKPAGRPAPASPGVAMTQERSPRSADTGGTAPKSVTANPPNAPTPVSEKRVSTGLTDPAQEQRVMTMGELPLSIRQELPSMQISVHLYSTRPQNSFVSINSRMLQEGEDLAPGIRLERITPDGMIFSYKGYRFRRGVQ